MGFVDDFESGARGDLLEYHGEPVTYSSDGGPGSSITAIVESGFDDLKGKGDTRRHRMRELLMQVSATDVPIVTPEKDKVEIGGTTWTVMEEKGLAGGIRLLRLRRSSAGTLGPVRREEA